MKNNPNVSLAKLEQMMRDTNAALNKLSTAVEKRKQRKATKTTVSSDGRRQWKTMTVGESEREVTIFKQRADGWVFFEAKEMPNDNVELKFWKKVESTQVDGIDKTIHAQIRKAVQDDNINASPALVQQKITQAIDVYKSTGVLPKTSTQPKMGLTKTVEVSTNQRDATIASYKKSNWRYLSEKQNTDLGITRIVFEKM